MDLRKLKTLVDLVSESNIAELEITEADGKVRIVKGRPADGHGQRTDDDDGAGGHRCPRRQQRSQRPRRR